MQRGLMLALSVVLGAVRAFQMPAQQALHAAAGAAAAAAARDGLQLVGMQAAIIGGPALGGLLYAGRGVVVYGASVAAVRAGAARCVRVRYRQQPPPRA